MAAAVQKNGIKPLSNGNGLVHQQGITEIGDYPDDVDCKDQIVDQLPPQTSTDEAGPEIDIMINNVVCSFSVRCHLNLRQIALQGTNVEYRKENGMITMKLRR